ncbi:YfcE family phosphodiesterase [Microlunatus spumicola]|uniref:Phosphoesterase n=1 Tax=Microlunatus spumicola TaxID=81499 RepID=A0ABP6X6M3_9ACTN
MRVVLVSDTHAPRFWKGLPPAVAAHLAGADLILHAGDVCVPSVLDELAAYAPVVVVQGNNDGAEVAAWGAEETWQGELDGLRVAMIHDAGPKQGRTGRMHRRFPEAELVVFGHSHIPLDESETWSEGTSVRIVNPGSPTDKRRQPFRTLGLLDVTAGRIERLEIVPLP